jgi:predicted P-loop ATPase
MTVLPFTPVPNEDWKDALLRDERGRISGSIANIDRGLRHAPQWHGVLRFNEFTLKVETCKRPPFPQDYKWTEDQPWTDGDDTLTKIWFHRQGIPAKTEDVGRTVYTVAQVNTYHPVREYLDGLVWGKVPRLDNWLIEYAEADIDDEDEEYAPKKKRYVQTVSAKYPISAVARIYEAGVKVDTALVLEGEQYIGKSKLLRTVFEVQKGWFADDFPQLDSKDAKQATFGVWVIELAEMANWTKTDSEQAKAFLSRQTERYRPPYGKNTIDQPRQCVFAGTINPTLGGYLKDPTGNRRYWVVLCHKIDLDGLAKVRDQLLAEAVVRYKQGEHWWLNEDEYEIAKVEQAERLQEDAWEDAVADYVKRLSDTTATEILENSLHLETGRISQADRNRVAKIMTGLGWKQKKMRVNGEPRRRWVNPRQPVKDVATEVAERMVGKKLG